MWNIYDFYYNEILRYEFLVKYSYENINKIFKIKEINLYINLFNKNINKDLDVLKYILLFKILNGQMPLLKIIKFKFKLDNKNVNFLCKVNLRKINLNLFLNLFFFLPKNKKKIFFYLFLKKNYNLIHFDNLNLFLRIFFFKFDKEFFKWVYCLNLNFKFNQLQIRNFKLLRILFN